MLHCTLSLAAQCIVIGPVCVHVCNGRAGGVRTLLQPARAQCLRLSERFFHWTCYHDRQELFDVIWKNPSAELISTLSSAGHNILCHASDMMGAESVNLHSKV